MVDALPVGGKKQGADGGIDRIIYVKLDGKRIEKVLVPVKGGNSVSVTMIRDLHSALKRETRQAGGYGAAGSAAGSSAPYQPLLQDYIYCGSNITTELLVQLTTKIVFLGRWLIVLALHSCFLGYEMRFIFLTTAALSVGIAPAQAANFSGPRVEVRGGWDRITLKAGYVDGVDSASEKGHKDGYTIGGEAGYDGSISPNVTLGAYAGIDFPHTRECSEIFGNDRGCIKSPRNITAGIRLGTLIGKSALVYVKGGFSKGRLTVSYADFDDATNNFSVHSDRNGFHLGLGGEVLVANHAYVKAELVHTNYCAATTRMSGRVASPTYVPEAAGIASSEMLS